MIVQKRKSFGIASLGAVRRQNLAALAMQSHSVIAVAQKETAMSNIKLVNDIDACIAAAHKGSGVFSEALHLAAFNCLHHVDANGDTRPLNRLFEKLPIGAQNALKAYCLHFGAVKYDADLLGFKLNRSIDKSTDEYKAIAAERETVGPMEYRREVRAKVTKQFDLASEISKLITRAIKNGYSGEPIKALQMAAIKA